MTKEQQVDLLLEASVTVFDWEENNMSADTETLGLARYVQGKIITLISILQDGSDVPAWLFDRVLKEAASFSSSKMGVTA